MKFKLMPFRMGKEYLLETAQNGSGVVQHFIGEWNGFGFSTYETENGVDMLCDRTIIGYICLSEEEVK